MSCHVVSYLIVLYTSIAEPDPQGTGRVDIHTHPYTTAACAAGVVTKTTDRDSLRYTYNGTRRVRQLALGCESS